MPKKKKRGFAMKKMPLWWQRQSYMNRKEVFPSILRHQISRYLSKEIAFERLHEWLITNRDDQYPELYEEVRTLLDDYSIHRMPQIIFDEKLRRILVAIQESMKS